MFGEIQVKFQHKFQYSSLAPTKLYYALAFCILIPLTITHTHTHTHIQTKLENQMYTLLLISFNNPAMCCMLSSQIKYVQQFIQYCVSCENPKGHTAQLSIFTDHWPCYLPLLCNISSRENILKICFQIPLATGKQIYLT